MVNTYGNGWGCPCPSCGTEVALATGDPHRDGEEFNAWCEKCDCEFRASYHVTSHYEGWKDE